MKTVYDFNVKENSHFGGDLILAENFINVMKGNQKSISELNDGILSAHMCIAAGISAKDSKFVTIDFREQ